MLRKRVWHCCHKCQARPPFAISDNTPPVPRLGFAGGQRGPLSERSPGLMSGTAGVSRLTRPSSVRPKAQLAPRCAGQLPQAVCRRPISPVAHPSASQPIRADRNRLARRLRDPGERRASLLQNRGLQVRVLPPLLALEARGYAQSRSATGID